ncbi:hypothetical protein GCM10010976_31050 [Bizionia arctica]|uniref:Uncharacterized protein n=1 Tax=Bizionia arctica TaxID=1495645 RepID=A0A917LUD1_9FLAO|nr:hypothetical protein GCM10010976_31050 [Bizionia arctica]
MRKTVNLIIGILALGIVFYSFLGNSEYTSIFGFELNIWIYRLIWSVVAILIFYEYSKKKKVS